jgi:cyclopropane fatty-acyl-phospholipid synthase-like methyltransferase
MKGNRRRSYNKYKKNILLDICIIFVLVFIVMTIFQRGLDKSRPISMHCYIRNISIVFTIYYLINYKWSWWILALPFIIELIIEFGHTNQLFTLDKEENKTINCYNFFEKISRTDPELDYYTEGLYNNNPNISMKEAQDNKFKWMCDQGNITNKTRVLDIGSGRCDFLYYAKNKRKANVTGCTISPDQIPTCNSKGIPVFMIDITNDKIPEKYKGKFDVIVLNGSAEHFRQYSNKKSKDKFWSDFFRKLEVLYDPNSNNKRLVITMIHIRRNLTFNEKIDNWFLDKGFGGSYPVGKYGLVKNAKNYDILLIKDSTYHYDLYTKNLWEISKKNMGKIVMNNIINLPIQLVNNPYYLHTIYAVQYSWGRQFVPNGNLKPPMLHQWIILKLK